MHLLGISGLREILKNAGIEEYKLVETVLLGFTVTFVVMFESR